MSEQVKRKIHFFEVKFTNCFFEEIVLKLNSLKDAEIYSKEEDKWFYLSTISKNGDVFSGIIRSVRLNDLPSVAKLRQKNVSPLVLEKDEGLSEASHFLFFQKCNILVMEYNFHGPTVSLLGWHINDKIFEVGRDVPKSLEFHLIMNNDFQEKLKELGDVYSVEMAFPVARVNELKKIDAHLFEAISKVESFGEVDIIELKFKTRSRSKSPMLGSTSAFKTKILNFLEGDKGKEVFTKFKMNAFNKQKQKKAAFDLLEEKFCLKLMWSKQVEVGLLIQSICLLN